ncbi:WAT1-related protein At5g07050 isoform X2 [Rosa chinensis]|uniref:WAT1-related protein At5g07050 isoform X2 n=1 Tax=Rosa chinensis TaxID=74649 RepID=UPI001AD8CF0A|nr:WAT1-related protein At5g07050 isoform X2 [Rosa chinensis]
MQNVMQMEEQEERVKGSRKWDRVIEESKPYILCIFCNVCFAGYNIVSKVALHKGMSRYVLVVYGYAFGTLATALFAFLFERKNESKINVQILRNVFFLGLLGALGSTLYYMGLEYTSPAFTSAMANMTPSITFILAVLCRMEQFDISKPGTQAKIGGTLAAFAGATLMTLYKGVAVITMHTKSSHQTAGTSKSSTDAEWLKGSLVLIVSYSSFAASYILQTSTIKMYPAPITLTSLTCLSGTLLSTIMAGILDHKASSWKLSWNTLLAPIYCGTVIYGITFYVQTLVVITKGPVFTTAFRPLATIVVAIMGLLILGEAIYLGSVLGAFLIVLGLYATLWGKKKEKEKKSMDHGISQQAIDINLEK